MNAPQAIAIQIAEQRTARQCTSVDVEYLRECFDANFEQGLLIWRNRTGVPQRLVGKFAGRIHSTGYHKVYLIINGRRRGLLVHRVLWCLWSGNWPRMTIDHIDCNRANNAISNLREASYTDQNANRPAIRAGLKGATFDKRTQRFVAQINRAGRNHFIGRYTTEAEAHAAYIDAAKRLHGEFARW